MWTSRNQLLAVASTLGREHEGSDKVLVLDIEGGGGAPMSAKLKGKILVIHANVTLTCLLLWLSCQLLLRRADDFVHTHRL